MLQYVLTFLIVMATVGLSKVLYAWSWLTIFPYMGALFVAGWFIQSEEEREMWRASFRRWFHY